MQQSTSTANNVIEKDTNKQICEANGCYKQATNEIKLDVGQFGRISLFLCKECLPKFTTKEVNDNFES